MEGVSDANTCKTQTCEEEEEVDGNCAVAMMSLLEAGAGAGKIERESSVMRLPNKAGTGWAVLDTGDDATKDAGTEEEEEPKQLESGSAAGT